MMAHSHPHNHKHPRPGNIFGAGARPDSKKSDPYGANQQSPIPNPTSDPGGEPIPSPGLPDKYPDYLKPIPINTRDVREEMMGYINNKKPEVMRILYSTWNADREAIKFQEIRNAIRDGEFSEQFYQRFTERYAETINEEFAPQWEAAIASSAESTADKIESTVGAMPRFDESSRRILDWLDARGGELAVNLAEEQHRALRSTLKYYTIEEPIGAKELGRIIRAQVGLTDKQAAAVRNFRKELVEEGKLTKKQIEHKVQNYAGRLHRVRAERIARTELSWAHNRGHFEQMRQANEGVLKDSNIVKEWVKAGNTPCPHCDPLDGQMIDLEETFPGATERVPNTYTPPAHPNCGCTLVYNVVRNPDQEDEDN